MDDLEVSRIPILGNLLKYESKVLSGVSRDEIIQSGTRYNKPEIGKLVYNKYNSGLW